MKIARYTVVLLLSIGCSYGADSDPSLFAALKWRNIGPNRGGRSLAATGIVGRPAEYYFGAVGGGVWKTTDGGTTWKPVSDGQLSSSSVRGNCCGSLKSRCGLHRDRRDGTARQHHAGRRCI